MDIIILSSIVSFLFIYFIVACYKELSKAETEPQSFDNGPRAQMIRFVGSIFDQSDYKASTPEVKKSIIKNMQRTISDMESDGVYFPDEVKEELEKRREELICEYSGLPGVSTYE